MRKILLPLLLILLLSTSFKEEPKETWVGTFQIYVDETGSIVVYYRGNVPQCVSKKVIDFIYEDCDTNKLSEQDLGTFLYKQELQVDTCEPTPRPTKTKRI